jgi:hypothetical protein
VHYSLDLAHLPVDLEAFGLATWAGWGCWNTCILHYMWSMRSTRGNLVQTVWDLAKDSALWQ